MPLVISDVLLYRRIVFAQLPSPCEIEMFRPECHSNGSVIPNDPNDRESLSTSWMPLFTNGKKIPSISRALGPVALGPQPREPC